LLIWLEFHACVIQLTLGYDILGNQNVGRYRSIKQKAFSLESA
jgi:hypothetical protein